MTTTDPMTETAAPAAPGEPSAEPGDRFGAASPGARRLPPPSRRTALDDEQPRRRRWWFWLIIVVVMAGVGAGCYYLGRHLAPKPGPQVVSVRQGVVAGNPVTAADLTLVQVTTPPTGALTSLSSAVGHTALRNLPVGAVVVSGDIGDVAQAFPRPGRTLVGVAVKPGQEPASGLITGQYVVAVEQPESQNNKPVPPVRLTAPVEVVAVATSSDGTQSVTLSVPSGVATALGVQASAGNVALIEVPAP
jgi:SAF domain